MSRIGKKPVEIPPSVEVRLEGQTLTVKGPKGVLSRAFHPKVRLRQEDGKILVEPVGDDRLARSLHGLSRTLVANMVEGVVNGYEKVLEIHGVGYRAQLQGRQIVFSLGFSHPVVYTLPEGIEAKVERQTRIILRGIDKEKVGQVAAEIRALKPPEPYKGKGIRYRDEVIRRKAGKAGR